MLGQFRGAQVSLDWASTYDDAVEGLVSGVYDLLLVDYFLEDRTGLELLAEAKERRIRTPMVMLTGRGSRSVDLEAMRQGAVDYLVKGSIDPDLLERTVRYAVSRARAEQALRASEARHREMFDHLPIGLYRCEPDGTFLDANPCLVRMLGRPDPDRLHEHYARTFYVSPSDVARFREQLETEGLVRGFETWLTHTEGHQILVRNTARAHREAGGRVAYIEGAVEDVTQRDRVVRVREEAARFRAMFEDLPVRLAVLAPRGRVLEASPLFRETLGRDQVELLARPVFDLVHPDDRSDLREALARAAGGEEPPVLELRFVADEIPTVWGRATLTAVRDEGWEIDQILLMVDEVQEGS